MKIYEVIYFCNEIDLLEAHINESQKWVDKIFVKESTRSWSGQDNLPLLFSENKKRFEKYDKAEVIVIPKDVYEEVPTSYANTINHQKYYNLVRDNLHRSRDYKWKDICSGANFVLSHDCDEIIDSRKGPEIRAFLKKFHHLDIFAYNLHRNPNYVNNDKGHSRWIRGFNANMYRPTSGYKRYKRKTFQSENVSGWHLQNCLWPEDLKRKAELISCHIGYKGYLNVPELDFFEKKFKNTLEGGNPLSWEEYKNFGPEFIINNIQKFPHKFLS